MRCVFKLFLAISIAVVSPALSASLKPGAYVVQVRLILPNLDDMATSKHVRVCISPNKADQSLGLNVLSDNNPLSRCPITDLQTEGSELTFDIRCPGGNAASGNARYRITATGFDGRITMKMGGKNMTMTETQVGKRVGDCPHEESSLQ